MQEISGFAISADGVRIAYDVQGSDPIALILVHGWCCNRSFWDAQLDYLTRDFTVVRLDLAGHGESGAKRTAWTMRAFGEDVAAVVKQSGLNRTVLVGHSMGGSVIVEAARRLDTSVVGLVGVDTWHDVLKTLSREEVEEVVAPGLVQYDQAIREAAHGMFLPTSDSEMVERVVDAMSAVPREISIGSVAEFMAHGPALREGLEEIKAPMATINSARWQKTNVAAARQYGIEVVMMRGVGHFVMLEAPEAFSRLLKETVEKLVRMRDRS